MTHMTLRVVLTFTVDLILLVICLLHLPSVNSRAAAPFEVEQQGTSVVVTRILDVDASASVLSGDRILEWKGLKISIPEETEFLGDMGLIGEAVTLSFERGNEKRTATITLIPFYPSPRFLIITLIVGIIVWGMGVFILWSAPPDRNATVLHWTTMAFGVTILITPGAISPNDIMSVVDRFLFFLAYTGVAALFFFFTIVYPRPKYRNIIMAGIVTFVPAILLIGGMTTFHVLDLFSGSLEHFELFQDLFDLFHLSLFLYIGGAVFHILKSLKNTASGEERNQLQWIIWGLSIASSPFLFLFVLPQLLFSQYVIAEEYATIFFLAVPFSWSMSFLKYHFLDIEILINRSIVYTLLTGFMVVFFGLVFFLATTAFKEGPEIGQYFIVATVAVVMTFLVVPLRDRLQDTIDETIFAARAHFRSALKETSESLRRSLTIEDLYETFSTMVSRYVLSETAAVYILSDNVLLRKAFSGKPPLERIHVAEDIQVTLRMAKRPVSNEEGKGTEPALREWMETTGCSVCIPMTNKDGSLLGIFLLSPRTRSDRFQQEEYDLISSSLAEAMEVIERLRVQERVFLEQEEKKRLEELSRLKTYFVSSVSHELRTPLTSIRMFAETLLKGRISAKVRREYLRIIEGESERLSRLIENILDFSKIERGAKEYTMSEINVGSIARRAVRAIEYQFKKRGVKLRVTIRKRLPLIVADPDALEEAILNLLSNALKYSTEKTRVGLSVNYSRKHMEIEVSDKGIGISKLDIPHIFGPFYRGSDNASRAVGGAGLGLPVVKHIVDAHRGTISVKSSVGIGSVFIVRLPVVQPAQRGAQ